MKNNETNFSLKGVVPFFPSFNSCVMLKNN